MMYLVYGDDRTKALKEALRMSREFADEYGISSILRCEGERIDRTQIEELPSAQGLFESRLIVLLDRVFSNEEVFSWLIPLMSDFSNSANIFVVLEDALTSETKKLETLAKKTLRFDLPQKKEERFNVFALADALGRRDKKTLWVLYQKALRHNLSPEEIHGTLAWQVRMMAGAENAKNAEEAGQKPFVFGKAKQFALNYKGNVIALSETLVRLFHESRQGRFSLADGLERFIVSL